MSISDLVRRWFLQRTPGDLQDQVPQEQSVPEHVLQAISGNVAIAQQMFSNVVGHDLPPSRAGVEYLDGFIERQRTRVGDEEKNRLADVLGSYLGASIVAEYGGKWYQEPAGIGIRVNDKFACFPINKARKHLFEGSEDSVLAFFNGVPAILAHAAEKNA
jgi:hypothetical protein